MTTPAAQPETIDYLFPGDLVWIVTPASPEDWYFEEYADAARLIDTDPANNRGLVAFFNFEVKRLDVQWVDAGRLERRLMSEGVFTFDRVEQQQRTAA